MSLTQFYHGKTILLTGATGFLGKVILEKICRSLPTIRAIYIAVTPKDGGSNAEYMRFKQEIIESQVFDRLKFELGMKNFTKLVREKLIPIPLDLSHIKLNLSQKLREEITQNLNIIINSAATIELDAKLDTAVRVNVTGPLKLLKLAKQSPKCEAFVQMSTVFVNSDRTGYVEETMYPSQLNWKAEYEKIRGWSQHQIIAGKAAAIKGFPDTYSFTKRMAEELLTKSNDSNIPMVIVRPSIVSASATEPFPGWTDTEGLLSGLTLAVGLGVMKDMPGNPESFFDIIPVDYVARQTLVAIPFACARAQQSQGQEKLLIMQSSTSSSNPTSAKSFFKDMIVYQNNFPYEKRAGPAQLTMHKDVAVYDRTFKLRSQLPTQALYYITRVFASKKMAADVAELKNGVESVRQANDSFSYYTCNEWVFDNATCQKLEQFLRQSSEAEQADFELNVKRINWKPLAMNHAYGVKRYVLNEEAALPSAGFNDSLVMLKKFSIAHWAPWSKKMKWTLEVRPTDEIKKLVLETTSVRDAMAEIVATKLSYYKNSLKLDVDENKIYQDVYKEASNSLWVIMANHQPNALKFMCNNMVGIFKRIYTKIVVNEFQIEKIKKLQASRKGPIVLCPNHRSYIDFLILSVVTLFYQIDTPHICAGEDLMNIKGISPFLRMCGAFFMRRTFKGDPLYKAIFTEYVTQLVKDRHVMEFFVEGTRSRSNKFLTPKFGILSIMNNAYFDNKVEEITFIPVNINYTRTLEDGSFPNELLGNPKMKESLTRILSAIDTLSMSFGSLYIDFNDPIHISKELESFSAKQSSDFNPVANRKDRLYFNNYLGYELVFKLQEKVRIMPTTLVATICLLYRKGISEETLLKQIKWLGMAVLQRGGQLHDSGLPDQTTLSIGLEHLDEYLVKKRYVLMPKEIYGDNQNIDYTSYTMLNYYRNPINHIFFNESLIVCSLMSFGVDNVWKNGVNMDDLFMRTCYLANLIKREEVLRKTITEKHRDVFDETIAFMQEQRLMTLVKDPQGTQLVQLKSSGEATMLMLGSICWPLIDTYYVSALFALSLVKRKDVEDAKFSHDVQWVAETMYQEGKITYFESCNQMVINNAKAQLLEMRVLQKKSIYINLASEYQKVEGEKRLEKLIETLNNYRNRPMSQRAFEEFSPDGELRRTVFSNFPIMAKL